MAWADFVVQLAGLMGGYTIVNPNSAEPSSDDDFNNNLPAIVNYTEGRIYREPSFDFLSTRGTLTSACTLGNRTVTKPPSLLVVEDINLIAPAGANPDDENSIRVPLVRQSKEYIDAVWPKAYNPSDPTTVGGPLGYAALNETTWRVQPTPAGAYVLEWVGVIIPAQLASTNTTTFLETNLPDLYLVCAMIFACGFMKNFGAQTDNPQMAQSWENQFQLLKTGAAVVEARKKMQGAGWTAYPPSTVANSPR